MKHLLAKICFVASLWAVAYAVLSCSTSRPEILWIEGRVKDGTSIHEIVIRNAGSLPENWTIWFSENPGRMETVAGSDAIVET